METPGTILKRERENQTRSLQDASLSLRIKSDYLKALEEDRYDEIPAEIFTRAYLRFYAEWLGLESSRILELYSICTEVTGPQEPVQCTADKKLPLLKKISALDIPWKPVLVLLLAVSLLTGAFFLFSRSRNDIQLSTEMIGAERAEASESREEETLLLQVTASELTWVSIHIDDSRPAEYLMRSGESLTFRGAERFALKIGNAGGTRLSLNNKDLGILGPNGKVVDIVLP